MKIYRYETRNIIEFDDGTRISLATKKYGDTLEQITEQIYETKYKLGNAYNILEDGSVEVLYWSKKELKVISIYLDYEDWFRLKEYTFTIRKRDYVALWQGNKKCRYFLHRVVMNVELDNHLETQEVVDHIDGNPLNNRKSNLRLVTFEINSKNRPHLSDKSNTGIRGIFYDKRDNCYIVYWNENGKTQHKYFKPCDFHKAVEFNIRIREENGYIIREEENN